MISQQELDRDTHVWRKRLQQAATEYALAAPRKVKYIGYDGIDEYLTMDAINVRADLMGKTFEDEIGEYSAPAWSLVTFDCDFGGEDGLGRVVFDDSLLTHVRFSINGDDVIIDEIEVEAGAINFATGILRSEEGDVNADEDLADSPAP